MMLDRAIGAAPSWRGANALYVARKLGLTSGLKLVLDAGDVASYPGAGQSWQDLSGNGYDFFLGATNGATTDDPTFNGAAGGLSAGEYWSFDGGDKFRYDTANETWMNNLHKDNALFSMAAWVFPAASALHYFFGTNGVFLTNIGINWRATTANGNMFCEVGNGSGSAALTASAFATPFAAGQWRFVAVSLNEAASAFFFLNNAVATAPAAANFTSPSASNATYTAEVAAAGNAAGLAPNGARMAIFMAWEGVALTAGQLRALFNATRGRFGV